MYSQVWELTIGRMVYRSTHGVLIHGHRVRAKEGEWHLVHPSDVYFEGQTPKLSTRMSQ